VNHRAEKRPTKRYCMSSIQTFGGAYRISSPRSDRFGSSYKRLNSSKTWLARLMSSRQAFYE